MRFKQLVVGLVIHLSVFQMLASLTSLAVGQVAKPELLLLCRKSIGGVLQSFPVFLQCDMPGQPPIGNATHDWYEKYDPNHADDIHHKNCLGQKYDYAKITVNLNWQQPVAGVGIVDIDDNKRHWDWVYAGYIPPPPLPGMDYSRNCHAHTYGKHDHPDDDYSLLGEPPFQPCYIPCLANESIVASHPGRHSIKVTGTMCELNPGIPILIPRIVFSSEQFNESGVYTRMNGCPNGLDIGLAHVRAKWDWFVNNYEPPYFRDYKPFPAGP
ncbi:MAG: hypothetical protein Q8M16_17940 [Pirellulaceae bacterium]|nr:hypothetical protein [Pirellulaceae bacterium]